MSAFNFIPGAASRSELSDGLERFVRSRSLVPPLPLPAIQAHIDAFIAENDVDIRYTDWLLVRFNNFLWHDTFKRIPPAQKLLLLPQCLRKMPGCPAQSDDLGLSCEGCGACALDGLLSRAESLGMMTLVAEGVGTVKRLIREGQIEAVIGAGCLESLERSFPVLCANAIPALAFPLLTDGCVQTQIDEAEILPALELYAPGEPPFRSVNAAAADEAVSKLFTLQEVNRLSGGVNGAAAQLGFESLLSHGKRYRPRLCLSVWSALSDGSSDYPDGVLKASLAVECFHKASLIHDDIEDEDLLRDGAPALHARYGVAQALNAGDWLLGEGYQLIAQSGLSAEAQVKLLGIAAQTHRDLASGQGEELAACASEAAFEDLLQTARLKTAPAFYAAAAFGAVCADAPMTLLESLRLFCDALGVAYQILDDLQDHREETGLSLLTAMSRACGDRILAGEKLSELACAFRQEALSALERVPLALKQTLFRVAEEVLRHEC